MTTKFSRRDALSFAASLGLTALTGCSRNGASSPTHTTTNPEHSTMPDYASTGAELIVSSKPKTDGFYQPAEWQPHECTIMMLPPPQNWTPIGMPMRDVREQWAAVANTIADFEPVVMVVRPEDRKHAKKLLSKEIELIEFPLNDGWSRDSGPVFVVNDKGERRIAGFRFNGWGGKMEPFDNDALIKGHLASHFETPMYPIDFVLEGGAVAVDGEGTLITTEQCLLNDNRNTQSREEVERLLNDTLVTEKVIWLGKGLEPDPITDGHVDGIAAFAGPGRVLLHTTEFKDDPNYEICRDAKRRLEAATDAAGRKLEVVELPLTSETVTHMNFYIGNGFVLVPTAGRKREDKEPMGILRDVFPDHKVIGVDGTVLGEGGGGIHCITQQVPRA